MNDFLMTIVSFPTAFFTFWIGLAMLYWLCATLGLVDIEILDIDVPDPDISTSQGEQGFMEVFSGILLRFGLNGVPITIIITLLAIVGWLVSYYLSYFSFALLGYNWTRFVVGIPVILISLYCAVVVTAQIIKPLRRFFAKTEQHVEKKILGQVAIVRSSKVDKHSGEVNFDDGGAGLILKVRTVGDEQFVRGDKVVLLEYLSDEHMYRVVSEAEFLGKTRYNY